MVNYLREKHSCVQLENIKVTNSIWITKKMLHKMNVDLNISNKSFDTIIKDKFRIKPHPIYKAKTNTKKFIKESHKKSFKRLP